MVFRPGDRVHVEYDATVRGAGPGCLWFQDYPYAAQTLHCTLIRPLLRVGDVITAPRDPEPPVGTVIRADYGGLFERVEGGDWQMAGHPMHFGWGEFDFDAGKILYLPNAESRPAPE